MTRTFATLEVSDRTFKEISESLRLAGYNHAFTADGKIDMHGIALACTPIIRCEHGVVDFEYCQECSAAYKAADKDPRNQ